MPANNTNQPAANAQPMGEHTSQRDSSSNASLSSAGEHNNEEIGITFGSFEDSDDESSPKIETNVLEPHKSLGIDEAHDSTLGAGSRSDGGSIANTGPSPEAEKNLDVLYGILSDESKKYRRLEQTLKESDQALKESKRDQQQQEEDLAKAKIRYQNDGDRKTDRIKKLERDLRCMILTANQTNKTKVAQQQSISYLRTDNQFLFQQVTKLSHENANLKSHRTHLMFENGSLTQQLTQSLTLTSELKNTKLHLKETMDHLTQQLKKKDRTWVEKNKKLQSENAALSKKLDDLKRSHTQYKAKNKPAERTTPPLGLPHTTLKEDSRPPKSIRQIWGSP